MVEHLDVDEYVQCAAVGTQGGCMKLKKGHDTHIT